MSDFVCWFQFQHTELCIFLLASPSDHTNFKLINLLLFAVYAETFIQIRQLSAAFKLASLCAQICCEWILCLSLTDDLLCFLLFQDRREYLKTLKGKYFNILGHFFSIYCVWKIFMVCEQSSDSVSVVSSCCVHSSSTLVLLQSIFFCNFYPLPSLDNCCFMLTSLMQ